MSRQRPLSVQTLESRKLMAANAMFAGVDANSSGTGSGLNELTKITPSQQSRELSAEAVDAVMAYYLKRHQPDVIDPA